MRNDTGHGLAWGEISTAFLNGAERGVEGSALLLESAMRDVAGDPQVPTERWCSPLLGGGTGVQSIRQYCFKEPRK
jgi:hypothetical protein